MPYGIIAVFDQTPFSNDVLLDAWPVSAASHANSGPTVEYALTSRTLPFQP